jgi:hypothetical protein
MSRPAARWHRGCGDSGIVVHIEDLLGKYEGDICRARAVFPEPGESIQPDMGAYEPPGEPAMYLLEGSEDLIN